jgi:hypothetical protein
VKQSMRYLTVMIAVFMSWTASVPSSFATDSMGSGLSAVRITPVIPQRALRDTSGFGSDPRPVTCAESAWALLRPVYPTSPVPKPQELRVTLHYGELALHFTSAPRRVDSLCTLVLMNS